MSRIHIYMLAAVSILFTSSCAKEIPEPLVFEPEPLKVVTTEGSLWAGENARNSFFSDSKASGVGDLITVHLIESTTASNKANTKNSRDKQFGLNLLTQSGTNPLERTQFGINGSNKFTGSGSTNRSEKLVSTISATITEVLSNGTMKIDGRRKLKINNSDQYIRVSGLIRREDINYDNSILSTKIANAEITYDGVGDLDRQQKSGWLGRALDTIWPF